MYTRANWDMVELEEIDEVAEPVQITEMPDEFGHVIESSNELGQGLESGGDRETHSEVAISELESEIEMIFEMGPASPNELAGSPIETTEADEESLFGFPLGGVK